MRWRRDRSDDQPVDRDDTEDELQDRGDAATGTAASTSDVGAAGQAPRGDGGATRPTPRRSAPPVPVDLGRVGADQLRTATRRVVARALTEDLAGGTDVTSAATVPVGTTGTALLVAREPGVVAGLDLVTEVCRQVDHRLQVELTASDGDTVREGSVVAELRGPLRTLLTAERTLLNLVCQLSGVATRTRAFADLLDGTGCVVRDTRKTTPGLRLLEKHAVAVGGGANHRIGLHDALLVKDNHVAAAGGVAAAARAALDRAAEGLHVQVEVTSMEEAEAALAEGVTDLLLDNFTPEQVREAVVQIDGRAAVEASGGITLATARAYAEAGADRLAVGALTHSAPSLDLALDVTEVTPPARTTFATLATTPVTAADPGGEAEAAPAAAADEAHAAPEEASAADGPADLPVTDDHAAVDDPTEAGGVGGRDGSVQRDEPSGRDVPSERDDPAPSDGPSWLDGDFTTER